MSVNIVLVGSTDRQLETILRACGMQHGGLPAAHLNTLAQAGAKQPDVLVLDMREQEQLPDVLSVLKRQHPATNVLIVAARLEPTLLLEAMRAGVSEVVSDPLNPVEIEAAIARLGAPRAGAPEAGRVFAFVGAKGGIGTTTVAVNVAAALARLHAHGTLLMDLHLANGDAAVFLGVEPRFSIVDALENTHRLDEAFLHGLIVRTKSGVDLLPSSDRTLVTAVDVARVRALIEFAARQYRYVVLDVPRSDAAMLDALEVATRIVVVTNQELATVRNASRMAPVLRHRYGKDKISLVLSRSDRHAEIGHEDVERAVGARVSHTFPSDYRLALQALHKGRPITLDNHNELSGSLASFAKGLAGVETAGPQRPTGSGLFSMFGARK